jgi:hypothetical protein
VTGSRSALAIPESWHNDLGLPAPVNAATAGADGPTEDAIAMVGWRRDGRMANGARITEAQLWHHGSRDDGDPRHGDGIHTRWHRSGGGIVTGEAIRQGGDIGGRGEETARGVETRCVHRGGGIDLELGGHGGMRGLGGGGAVHAEVAMWDRGSRGAELGGGRAEDRRNVVPIFSRMLILFRSRD